MMIVDTYDSENHMISMTGNGKTVTMIYDAFGNRVSKTVNGVTTQYLVEDDVNPTGLPQVVEELVNNAVTRQYTYGLQRISERQQIANVWTPSFYGYDGFGTVRQLTDINGNQTDSYEYDAFGNSFTKTGSTPNNYLYRGEQYDSDLGLYYLRARYYNPTTGRFLSRDPEDGKPTDPASLHKYLYAGGNPINMTDPTGRASMAEYALLASVLFYQATTYVSSMSPFEVYSAVGALTCMGKTLQGIYDLLGRTLYKFSSYQLPGIDSDDPLNPPDPVDTWCSDLAQMKF